VRKLLLIGALCVALLAAVGLGWYWNNKRNADGAQSGLDYTRPQTSAEKAVPSSNGSRAPQKQMMDSSGVASNPAAVHYTLNIALKGNLIRVLDGGLTVEGSVKNTSPKETIKYSSWIKTDFLDKISKNQKEVEETFGFDDKEFFELPPNASGPFMATLGMFMADGSRTQYSGKGVVLVYATPLGSNGIDKRISNLIRVEVDYSKNKASILEDLR